MPNYVIRAVAFASGDNCPHAGQWLRLCDHDAHDGQGEAVFTPTRALAMRFDTAGEALAFWNRQSAVRPLRPDGRPNKPLTALTCTIEPAP